MDPVMGIIIAVASVSLGLIVGIILTTYHARIKRHFADIENTIDGRIEELYRRVDEVSREAARGRDDAHLWS